MSGMCHVRVRRDPHHAQRCRQGAGRRFLKWRIHPAPGGCAIARVPSLRFSPDEHESGAPAPQTLRDAVALFRQHGCIVLDNTFTADFIRQLHDRYLERYRHYFEDRSHGDALKIGPGRYQITVELKPPFNTPMIYANPLVFPIVGELLGPSCILGVFGSVLSLPGADAQHVHRDHPQLYDDDAVNAASPAFAVTMMVPMVALDERTGTTRMWVGSHLVPDVEARALPFDDPMVAVGGCVLFDLRLMHGGLANTSEIVRPMLYNAYYRPWFVDSRNYTQQQALVMEEAEFNRMHRANRRLFVRAETAEGRRLTLADPYKNLPK